MIEERLREVDERHEDGAEARRAPFPPQRRIAKPHSTNFCFQLPNAIIRGELRASSNPTLQTALVSHSTPPGLNGFLHFKSVGTSELAPFVDGGNTSSYMSS